MGWESEEIWEDCDGSQSWSGPSEAKMEEQWKSPSSTQVSVGRKRPEWSYPSFITSGLGGLTFAMATWAERSKCIRDTWLFVVLTYTT